MQVYDYTEGLLQKQRDEEARADVIRKARALSAPNQVGTFVAYAGTAGDIYLTATGQRISRQASAAPTTAQVGEVRNLTRSTNQISTVVANPRFIRNQAFAPGGLTVQG